MSNKYGVPKLFLFSLTAFFISIFSAGNALADTYDGSSGRTSTPFGGYCTFATGGVGVISDIVIVHDPMFGDEDNTAWNGSACSVVTGIPDSGMLRVNWFGSWNNYALYQFDFSYVPPVVPATSGVLLDSSLWTSFSSALESNWAVLFFVLAGFYGLKAVFSLMNRYMKSDGSGGSRSISFWTDPQTGKMHSTSSTPIIDKDGFEKYDDNDLSFSDWEKRTRA